MDFAREKGILFDRWCASCKADDRSSLRELMLLEEFKNCLPERTTVYLNEQKVSTIQQAATLADEFTLVHKTVFNKRDSSNREFSQRSETQVQNSAPSNPKTEKLCFFCRKAGHLIVDCEAWKLKQQGSTPRQPKEVGLIQVSPRVQSLDCRAAEMPDKCFKPFIFDGSVSLSGKAEDQSVFCP